MIISICEKKNRSKIKNWKKNCWIKFRCVTPLDTELTLVYKIGVVIITAPLITANTEYTSCVSIMNNFQGKLADENHMFRGINIDAAFN